MDSLYKGTGGHNYIQDEDTPHREEPAESIADKLAVNLYKLHLEPFTPEAKRAIRTEIVREALKDQRERIRKEITSLPMMNNETPEKRATTYWLNTEHVLNLPSLKDNHQTNAGVKKESLFSLTA